jgi:hypothetical protein
MAEIYWLKIASVEYECPKYLEVACPQGIGFAGWPSIRYQVQVTS